MKQDTYPSGPPDRVGFYEFQGKAKSPNPEMIPELSINFPAMAYFDNQDSQNFLLDAVVAHSHTLKTVAVLELFHSRRQGIVASPRIQASRRFSMVRRWHNDP
ncbi:MAG: hypothetical protein PHG20_12370 [Geobacteraceae bacterium]|nr:hypothetical protein [Geobacteraceae bacterium]